MKYKMKNGARVVMTPEEEAARDAITSEWEAGAVDREWDAVRKRRNELLDSSDKLMLADVVEDLAPDKKQAWKDYRKALRDLPQNNPDPFNIVWPVEPV